jgi:hypothetical protein
MSREQVHKLIGGYATGTLTPEERQTLFEAALEDQQLFDALAREQSLRDLLRDPAAKAQLLAALGEAPATWRQRAARWMWGHAVGLAAVACFLTVGGYVARQAHFTPPRVVFVATQPTTVDVNGSQPPVARPRRVFDIKSVPKAEPAPPEMLTPPSIALAPRPVPALTHAIEGEYPRTPRPVLALALPPARAAGAMGGGRGAGGNSAAMPEALAVTAMAGIETRQLTLSPMAAALQPGPIGAGKLDPSLVALVQRVHSGDGPVPEESRLVSAGQANVRMTVTNTSADSLAQLRKAGFTITRHERNELIGRIAVEKLEPVTQLPFVVWIAPQ